jgi:NitT/TauT family transport system permease protein
MLIRALNDIGGEVRLGYWCLVISAWLMAWVFVQSLAALKTHGQGARRAVNVLIPVFFGLWILLLWEVLVRGFGIPQVLLPAPSQIWGRIISSLPILGVDFVQTFKAVIFGYLVGCLSGFAAAIVADGVPFLRRGLLPIGNLASALPIIGIAPVMVMWFGFDWRLPAALPFIFNALKINSTLALIGAIVAEFFGTPIVGMGFRISTEVGRMGIDMVWAEIAVAALAGSVFYGLVSLVERAVTFWHPSFRT